MYFLSSSTDIGVLGYLGIYLFLLLFFLLLGSARFLIHRLIYNYLNREFLVKYLRNYFIYSLIFLVALIIRGAENNLGGVYTVVYVLALLDIGIFYYTDYRKIKDKGNFLSFGSLSFLITFFVTEGLFMWFFTMGSNLAYVLENMI